MKHLVALMIVISMVSCSDKSAGTGTDTTNVIYPSLAKTKARIQTTSVNLAQESVPQSNAGEQFCYTDSESIECFAESSKASDHNYTGNVVTGTVLDSLGNPVSNAQVLMNSCGYVGTDIYQYEVFSDSNGLFELGVQEECVAIEVVMQEEGEDYRGFTDSLTKSEKELSITYPMNVGGVMNIPGVSDEQLYVVGIAGTKFSLVVKQEQQFKFVDVPRGVKYFYFLPIENEEQAMDVTGLNSIKIPIDQENHNSTRTIDIGFLP